MQFSIFTRRGFATALGAFTLTCASVSALAADAVRIGSILSVTGPAAFLGEDMKLGMEMAVADINAAGGINGKPVEWIFYDAESQTAKALNATRRLLNQDRVDVIVGGGNMSGIALAMAPMTERAKVPFISTEGSMQIVTPVSERPMTFKSTVDDDQMVERLMRYFKKEGITKAALLADSSGFGQSAVEQMKILAPQNNVEMVYESFNPADTDLTGQLTKIKASGAQAIVCWTVTPAGLVFIKQAQQLGLSDRKLIHSYGFVDQRYMRLAGDAAKDLLLLSVKFPVGTELPDADPVKANIEAMTQRFKEKYNRAPNQFVAQTYDAIMLVKLGMVKAGGDKEAFAKALETMPTYQGLGGSFNFSEKRHSGLSSTDVVLLGVKDGEFTLADY